jgi:hypothetical protein
MLDKVAKEQQRRDKQVQFFTPENQKWENSMDSSGYTQRRDKQVQFFTPENQKWENSMDNSGYTQKNWKGKIEWKVQKYQLGLEGRKKECHLGRPRCGPGKLIDARVTRSIFRHESLTEFTPTGAGTDPYFSPNEVPSPFRHKAAGAQFLSSGQWTSTHRHRSEIHFRHRQAGYS